MNQQLFPRFLDQGTEAPEAGRQVALLVHALPPQDQSWLLGQLPEGTREQIQPFLADLMELGIPADRSILEEALQRSRIMPVIQDSLLLADPVLLIALLGEEPPALLAVLLEARSWPWEEALLDSLDPKHRSLVAGHRSRLRLAKGAAGDAFGHRLHEELISRLRARLLQTEADKTLGMGGAVRRMEEPLAGAWWSRLRLKIAGTLNRKPASNLQGGAGPFSFGSRNPLSGRDA